MQQIQPLDWSATAAWIALIVSIVGTVVGPIVTTILTNKHQIKLRKLEIEEKQVESLNNARISAIENFIACVGQCVVNPSREHVAECGKHFFPVYAYVPESMWASLDMLYSLIDNEDWIAAHSLYGELAKPLALLLKETRQ